MGILREIDKCDQCKRTARRETMVIIKERKKGVLTGKQLQLCTDCMRIFFAREIKELTVPDQQKKELINWNKIWTPEQY